jgi:hypothetical protein
MIDRIIFNGNIYTQNPTQPRASAMAIVGERIVAVGDDDAIRPLATSGTQVDNLNGWLVLPGLTDAHVHWEGLTRALHAVDLYDVPSIDEAVQRVAEKARQTPRSEWVIGRGWRIDLWDGEFPTATALDAATTEHPVYLTARSGHAAWVNSAALRLAGINKSTPDPEGGAFRRLEDGRPSGILFESPAMKRVSELIPKPTPSQLADWMEDTQAFALRMGLTGIHDYDNPSCMQALQILRERGGLKLRFVKQINQNWLEPALELGIRSGFGDDWLRFGGLKMFADGALGPKTALMIEPYEDEPDNYGIAVVDKEEMAELASQASASGLLTTIHAIGDRAVHDVLDIFEAVRREEASRNTPRQQLRHRIEHVQVIHPDDVGRLAALDVIASMQPIHATSDYAMADRYWGKRAAYSYAMRKQLQAGAVLALGSDAPIETIEPYRGIHAAITRQRADGSPGPEGWYPEERLTLDEALRGYTLGPAFAGYMDGRLGMLAPGYMADLIVIDRDWFSIPASEILGTQTLGTMVGGEWQMKQFE